MSQSFSVQVSVLGSFTEVDKADNVEVAIAKALAWFSKSAGRTVTVDDISLLDATRQEGHVYVQVSGVDVARIVT